MTIAPSQIFGTPSYNGLLFVNSLIFNRRSDSGRLKFRSSVIESGVLLHKLKFEVSVRPFALIVPSESFEWQCDERDFKTI